MKKTATSSTLNLISVIGILQGILSQTTESQNCGCGPNICCSRFGICETTNHSCAVGCQQGPCTATPPAATNVAGVLSAPPAATPPAATFTVTNKCNQTVWPVILSSTAGTSPLNTTGFPLQEDESRDVTVPSSWTGRVWGRTQCSTQNSTGRFSCISGDCGSGEVECSGKNHTPPATLAEFSLKVPGMGLDFYDVSFVDGINLPMLVVPESGNCTTAGCAVNLNDVCPNELKVTSQDGIDVGCKSPCEAFGTPRYCCTGAYGTPDTCKPSAYSKLFKNACPRAYSYPFDDDSTSVFQCAYSYPFDDDSTSVFQCASTNYAITFCPPLPTM